MEKFLLLGASKGLGWEAYQALVKKNPHANYLLSSRKILNRFTEVTPQTKLVTQDFSQSMVDEKFYEELKSFKADVLIYFAGGGPYGLFQQKKWADHIWSINTSFLYPAQLLHKILSNTDDWVDLKKIIIIGSSIAEDKPDPKASSYCAAKHALKGLIESINSEQSLKVKIELFSPGYMQTDLLPQNSQPRLTDRAEKPEVVANRLIDYIFL